MFNRVIRDKIPGIGDICENTLDSGERDKDIIEKNKGKQAADKRRGAKEVDIEVGDKVLLKNVVFPNKLTSNFDKTEFTVLERHNNIVVIEGGGRKLTRNASHFKKVQLAKRIQPPAQRRNQMTAYRNQHLPRRTQYSSPQKEASGSSHPCRH